MTKSTIYHDRDGDAIDALRRVLPTFWLYKDPSNKYGGKEYSEDLVIEVVNDDALRTVTGVEFGIQNKTKVDVRRRHVTTKLQVDDIERLLDLPRPYLIHAYHIDSKISYYIWLDDWFDKHREKLRDKNGQKLSGHKEVSIEIPKKNVLEQRSIAKVEGYARWRHKVHKMQERAERVTRIYPNDYEVQVGIKNSSITTIVNPKHEGAVPTFYALDDSASEAMIRVMETGQAVPLIGKFGIENLPELLYEDFATSEISMWLIPQIAKDQDSPIKIELLNGQDEVILKSPFVNMRQVQPGTVISVWEGNDQKHSITYRIKFDRKAKTTEYGFHYRNKATNAQGIKEYFQQLDLLRTVKRIRYTHLETDLSTETLLAKFDFMTSPQESVVRRFADNIAFIEDTLKTEFAYPKRFDNVLLEDVEWIAEILREGSAKCASPKDLPEDAVIIGEATVETAQQMLNDSNSGLGIRIPMPEPTFNLTRPLLGQTIDLGPARYAFDNLKFVDVDSIRTQLLNRDHYSETSIKIILSIDPQEVYITTKDWPVEPVIT